MSDAKKKALVIVESPAKAKTIAKYLGSGYIVEASIGHIRDLPGGKKDVPEKFKSEPWAYLGVNVDDKFEPVYVVPPEKRKQVSHLKARLKEANELFLATDEDREGEAISWHLFEVLKPSVPVHRLVFHEITKEAIQNALKTTRQIDVGLVKAQETRRIVDRLYGYDVSQLLWRKVAPKLSAGRVQSVAVRLIVDRERERMAFHSATYFDLSAEFAKQDGSKFTATLSEYKTQRLPSGKDFDPATGLLKDNAYLLLDQVGADELRNMLASGKFNVKSVEVKPFVERPKPPFTTSTMQQEAGRKLGFTAKQAMRAAQNLYENGYITYMRTDSTTLASVAVDAARELVSSQYGKEFLHPTPRTYATKVKNAQEAHEAIRPAGHPFQVPEKLRSELNRDEFRLFELIWKRTIASQMADARKQRMTVVIEGENALFQASGTSIEFEGFLRAYVEGSDDPDAELAQRERLLPELLQGETLNVAKMDAVSHTTQPPARFTEASLTAALEERGIGRPSTYASIIDTIQYRDYVFKKGTALVPSWMAFAVIRLLEDNLGKLVNYQFTAEMEDHLDEISREERENLTYLQEFYFGNVTDSNGVSGPGLKPLLESKIAEIDPRAACSYALGRPDSGEFQEDIVVRVGKFGPFLEQGTRKASIPDDMAPDEINLANALALLDQQAAGDQALGIDPDTGLEFFVKVGRFGPYIQLGQKEDEGKRNVSLPKGIKPEEVSPEIALKYLSLPRKLGSHPQDGYAIIASVGPFGPYVKGKDKDYRSIPKDLDVHEITLEKAVELLSQPKAGRGRGEPTPPLRTLAASPVTEKPIEVRDGKYGIYITDGQTNATLPKETKADDLTFEQAVTLLAERFAIAPPKKAKRGAKKATKKAATKSTATKKTTKKASKKVSKKKT